MKGLIEMPLSDPTNWRSMPTADEIHSILNSASIESVANPITGNIDCAFRNNSTTHSCKAVQACLDEIREHYDNCLRSNLTLRQEPHTKSIFILCDCGKGWIFSEFDIIDYDRTGRIGFAGQISDIRHGKEIRKQERMASMAQNEAKRLAQEHENIKKDAENAITKFDNPMASLEV